MSTRTVVIFVAFAALCPTRAKDTTLGAALSPHEKQLFVNALISTPNGALETELPSKLRLLHRFKPFFSMYELASTGYALVLENPKDMRRWRALAKLDSYADGEYASAYEKARSEALSHRPNLLKSCPQFHTWSEDYRRDHTNASKQSMQPTPARRTVSLSKTKTRPFQPSLAAISGG